MSGSIMSKKASGKIDFFSNTTTSVQSTSLINVIENYTKYYASNNSHTSRAKRIDLKNFTDFLCKLRSCSKPEKLRVHDWDHSSVNRFVEDCLLKGESPATVARRLATLKHMGRTLAEKIAGFINPAREVKSPKVPIATPKAIKKKEIKSIQSKALARQEEKDSFIRIRNRMIFDFMLDTGLRAEEVRLLKLEQIDKKLEWIENVRTKGRRYRNVYITSDIRNNLSCYLEERFKVLKKFYPKLSTSLDHAHPLFLSSYNAVPGKPETFLMGAKTLWRAVNELSKDTPLHPHLLRHSYAHDLLSSSNDIRLVSQALGHSDIRTTMKYTERSSSEVANALEASRKKNRKAI
jgi:integrase/recombinase XerC